MKMEDMKAVMEEDTEMITAVVSEVVMGTVVMGAADLEVDMVAVSEVDMEADTGVDSAVDMAEDSEADMETVDMGAVTMEAVATVEVAAMAGIKEKFVK
jgi:hypothetical protein